MKRFWILLAGAVPFALATPTPADAGHGRGFNGPIVRHTTHQPGFIGAGHRVGNSDRFTGNHFRRHVNHVRRGHPNRGRIFFNRHVHRHGPGCGHVINHRSQRHPYWWKRVLWGGPWFDNRFRDHDFKKNRKRNRHHVRKGKRFDRFDRFDRFSRFDRFGGFGRFDRRFDRRFDHRFDHADSDSDHGKQRFKGRFRGRHR